MHDYFRGNPDGKSPLEFLREREPIRARVPRPRRPPGPHGRVRPRGHLAVPDPRRALRGAAEGRPRGRHRHVPAFNRWIEEDWGFAYEDRIFAAPYLTLADLDWAVDRAGVGARRGRPGHRHAPGGGLHRARAPVARPTDVRPVLGPGGRVRHHRRSSTPATAGYSSQGYADDKFTAQFSGGWKPSVRIVRHRAGRPRLPAHAHASRSSSTASRTCASPRSRTARSSCPTCSASCASTAKKIPGYFPEDPVDTFRRHVWINPFWEDDVLRGRRADGRRPGHLRLGLAPHRGHAPTRSTTCAELKELRRGGPAQGPAGQHLGAHPAGGLT